MKLNIFRIPESQRSALRKNVVKNEMTPTSDLDMDGWKGQFFFSEDPNPGKIPWVSTFSEYIGSDRYYNRQYYAVMLVQKGKECYAISFGKAHFYIRPYCDYDFGIEIAKRIADENEIGQTAARRYQGKQTKDIRSFGRQSRLNIPPGNSVDFIQGRIRAEKTESFGTRAKFGTSCLLTPDIEPDEIGSFLTLLNAELAVSPQFKLPRTLVLSSLEEVSRYDEKLIDELSSPVGTSEVATDTFDLFGVDFVFSSSGSFTIKCGHYKPNHVDGLTMKEIKEYIAERNIPRDRLLALKIIHHREGEPDFSQAIKEAVDFICDEDHVVLRGGKWLQFNEDYLDALDGAIRQIRVEETEVDLASTALEEGSFNESLAKYGYSIADKNFKILETAGRALTEAWDLQKGDTVYAVKFGTPQKLNYVVDQAMSVLEIIRNGANLHNIPPFDKYCLWMGYRAKRAPRSLADSGSIILKQKVEAWARLCEEAGFTPVLKLSRKLHPHYDFDE